MQNVLNDFQLHVYFLLLTPFMHGKLYQCIFIATSVIVFNDSLPILYSHDKMKVCSD